MPPPKSPLEKPSSSHSRRPSSARRSSSDKSTKSSKHAVKPGSSSQAKPKDQMSEPHAGSKALAQPGPDDLETTQRYGDGNLDSPRSRSSFEASQLSKKEISSAEDHTEGGREPGTDAAHGRFAIPRNTSAEEVERLRAAMNAQLQLSQHRERLAQQLGGGLDGAGVTRGFVPSGKTRISPIHEETMSPSLEEAFATPITAGLETASTESAKTVRGGITPVPQALRTPSYPFPSMRTPGPAYTGHRPFTALSPTVNPSNYADGSFDVGLRDRLMSGSVTPASTMRFKAPGASESPGDVNFETPNLYDLSLMLSSEPGLDPWWTTVVQIMKTLYQAHRVTLSVPADPTDIENVPWGQKATFNIVEEDQLSLGYLPRGGSLVPSSSDTNNTSTSEDTTPVEESLGVPPTMRSSALRPGLLSRHSFTAYEDTKRDPVIVTEANRVSVARPSPMVRAKSYLSARPDIPPRTATLQNAQLNLQSLADHIAFEDANPPSNEWEPQDSTDREVRGQVFSGLQALDYESEPLIDNKGVFRVVERGKVIALTRDYPYVEQPRDDTSAGSKSSSMSSKSKEPGDNSRPKMSDVSSRISSFFGGKTRRSGRNLRQPSDKGKSIPSRRSLEVDDVLLVPRYEEYEQAPPSPWSQSPAPSPAVRAETSENPFFVSTPIDEESFNPQTTSTDYADMPLPETIGLDRSWTVLHIPLIHPLLSKPVQSFRLDAAAMESKSAGRAKWAAGKQSKQFEEEEQKQKEFREKQSPIAILSILSPVIPYPSTLRHSLEQLAPHLATSFSLCRHFSNLETEIAGLSRKRPQTTGFGAVAGPTTTGDRQPGHPAYSPNEGTGSHQYTAGSLTSPSDYSGVSRSTLGSDAGTPGGWDPSNIGLTMDRRSSGGSPSYVSGDSYFTTRTRPGIGRVDTGSATGITGARRTSKESSPVDARSQKTLRSAEDRDTDSPIAGRSGHSTAGQKQDVATSTNKQDARASAPTKDVDTSENKDQSPPRQGHDTATSARRVAMRTASNQGVGTSERQHTQLHSYGADFSATFQSLPNPSVKTPAQPKLQSRSNSVTVSPDYMPPPSDRVKGIMLDSLPLHIFIALPPTGEMVWVNSRYLTYRGQSVKDLQDDPWASIHHEERDEYLKGWSHAVRTGEQFSMQVRLKRFDGTYRWFYTRAVGLRDSRGVIVQWYGTHMDIHDQHIAEVKAARQEEIEASEAKHRQLANLIPQIIFSATEDEGVTFANEQWLSYTGQAFEDSLGLGFMNYVHPDDLAKVHIPQHRPLTPNAGGVQKPPEPSRNPSQTSSGGRSSNKSSTSAVSEAPTERTIKNTHEPFSRTNSSSSGSAFELATGDLTELMKTGTIKVQTDSNGRTSYSTEVRLRSKSGEYRWHLVRCVEVDNINLGSGDGSWFGACADINDHKLLEMKLKEAMESKSKFLSNMSHEIRTPLIGISGMISFLQDTPLNDEQMDYCNTISSSADGLLNIINDILDLAKADAGMMKLSYDWFHTRSLVEEVNEMVSTIAITKHLEVNYVVDIDVPDMVKGDRFRIRQVLLNVIGNAIKFTTVGEVFSRCRVMKSETADGPEDEVVLEFSIIDTGRGFSQEEAELIFKPFSQIDGSSTRTHGGTGLGLVISRQFVELHGGKMEGTAIPGKGSTFTFTVKFGLPTEEDHPDPPSTPSLSQKPSARSSLRSSISFDTTVRAIQQTNPVFASKLLQSPPADSPRTESSGTDSHIVLSSGSSVPSIRSLATNRSSASSIPTSLSHFGQAAKAIALDPSNMKLELPDRPVSGSDSTSQGATPTAPKAMQGEDVLSSKGNTTPDPKHFRPPMYSILLICPQTHSREATTQHIEMTLPKDIPHQITSLASIDEARTLIGGEDPVIFTHIVLNLGSAEDIVTLVDQIVAALPRTIIVVLSDPVQRQEVIKMANGNDYEQLAKDNRITFIYKPVKPSRFAVIFDPDKERDLSTDRNRFSAQQQVATQRQNYLDIGKRLGNKGHRVLLVEDNATNQKVLLKFLSKVGIAVDLALDGVECTDQVFAKPHSFYSLILVCSSSFPVILFTHPPLPSIFIHKTLTQPVRSPHAQ